MPSASLSLRLRQELGWLREQVGRMAEEHRSKRSVDFQAAHFAASSHLTEMAGLVEKMSLGASQGPSGCNCHIKEG